MRHRFFFFYSLAHYPYLSPFRAMASFAPLASGQYIFPGEMHTFQVVPFANLERGANPSMKPPFSFLLSIFLVRPGLSKDIANLERRMFFI